MRTLAQKWIGVVCVVAGFLSTNARAAAPTQPLTNGLAAWFDASDLSLADGAMVSIWGDASGNARDAAQVVAASRPIFLTNVVNGLPALRFDGTDDYLDYDGTFLAGTDYTVFVVEGRLSNKDNAYFMGGNTGAQNENMHLGYRTDTQLTHAQYGNDYNMAVPGYASQEFHLYSFHLDATGGSGRQTYRDGSLLGSLASTATLVSYNGAHIGTYGTGSRYEGDLTEILIYDRYLDTKERNLVGDYLATKYGLDTGYVDPAQADIAVSVKLLSPAVASIGSTVEYTVTAINNGYTNASAVVVSNMIPPELNFVSATGGVYSAITGEWVIPSLDYLAATTLTVRATVKTESAGQVVTVAAGRQSADQADYDPSNDASSVIVPVREEVDAADFAYRVRIDIPGYDRAETLYDFPVLVDLNDLLPGFAYDQFASSEGYDLRFLASNGTTVLKHDVETWNPAGDSHIWVQVDALSPGTHIWAVWGNAALTTPPASLTDGLTWAEGFGGVYHLNEPGAGDPAMDAGPLHNDGAPSGAPPSTDAVIAGGRDLAGIDRFVVGDTLDLSGKPFTVSVWANRLVGTTGDNMWVGGGTPAADHGLHVGFRNNNLWFGLYSDDGTCTNDYSGDRDAWHHYAMVLNADHSKQIYRDGQPVPTSGASNDFYQSKGLVIGTTYDIVADAYRGKLDEVRASMGVARSADWIWATWMTTASNGVFTSISGVSGMPVIANLSPTGITDTAAFFNGELSFTGSVPTTVALFWGETPGGAAWGTWGHTNVLGVRSAGMLSEEVTGLAASTAYAYTYYASNSFGEVWATPEATLTTRSTTYWTVTVSAGPNGQVNPAGDVTVDDGGTSDLFVFEPDVGYHVTNVLVDAASIGATNSYQLTNVTADRALQVLFGINQYTVTVNQVVGGTIAPAGPVAVDYGADASFTLTPVAGYYVTDVLVDGESIGPLAAPTLHAITNDTQIEGVFGELPSGMVASNLVLWLNGGSIAQSNGTFVTSWTDFSGRGNHAVQDVRAFGPRFYNDRLGPHPYFDGTASYMTVGDESQFDLVDGMTIILVGRQTSGATWRPYIAKNGEPSGWQFREFGNANVLSFTTRGLTGSNTDAPQGTGDIQLDSVLAGRYSGSTLTKEIWYNGTPDGALTYTGGALSVNDDPVVLGARDNGGIGGFASCDIYELLVYDGALSDRDLNSVGYYLARKYGIASGYTDPFGPTVTADASPSRRATSAQLVGTLVSTGSAPATAWAYWDTTDQGSNRLAWAGVESLGSQPVGSLAATASGLQADTDYVCRFFASNIYGMAWSDPLAFESGVLPVHYANAMRVQFSGYAGTRTLTNFPALVRLSPQVTNFSYDAFDVVDGGDLRFTDAARIQTLNFEVERWATHLDNRDVGAVGAAGSLAITGTTYVVRGSGADVWGGADECHYAYTHLAGDGSISVHVKSINNPGGNAWCKSGVMIREDLASNGRNVFMLTRTDGQTVLQYRDTPGANSVNLGLVGNAVPGWLRLVRTGDTFSGYTSFDGTTWTLQNTQTVAMATNVLIGMAVTSHADGNISTVEFDNLSLDVPNDSPVWVQVPTLAGNEDYVWAFWGNPAQNGLPPYAGDGTVWAPSYEAVWHLVEHNAADAARNDHNGTGNSNVDAEGLIGGAQSFTNVGSIAVAPGIDIRNRSFSFETWSKRSVSGDNDFIAGQGAPGDMLHIGFRANGQFAFAFWGDDLNVAGPWDDTTAWHHWACVYDSATRSQELFRDGVSIGTRTAGEDFTGSGTFYIGARGDGGYNFQGLIDETRLSNVVLSPDWIVASYNNQAEGSTFVTFSDEPPPPPGTLLLVR